jgi:flagellar hook-basal body complex protein FliE
MDHLKSGLEEVNSMQKKSDAMAMNIASGKSENLHETMIAATQAEISFNLMVQLRNRALEAYQEVMRMPV